MALNDSSARDIIRRVHRIFFYCAAACSLLLCIASALLWARGKSVADQITWGTAELPQRKYLCRSCRGRLVLTCFEYRSATQPDFGYESWKLRFDAEEQSTWHGFAYEDWGTDPVFQRGSAGWDWRLRSRWSVPHWFLVLITGLLPSATFYRRLRRKRRAPPGHCIACGYDCRAMPDRCPECSAIPAAQAARPGGAGG